MIEKFEKPKPNKISESSSEHAERLKNDIETLGAFDDNEWLDMVHRTTLYSEAPILTPKELVDTLKHLGFKSFEDFYTLDLNSKYEVLHDLGIADYNKPNFLLNSVLGFLNKSGGFEYSNKTNFEKCLDETYATYISFYNRPKEEIDEEKDHDKRIKKLAELIGHLKDQEKEVMDEFNNTRGGGD